eukprot:3861474-Rhodomonas_salina.1
MTFRPTRADEPSPKPLWKYPRCSSLPPLPCLLPLPFVSLVLPLLPELLGSADEGRRGAVEATTPRLRACRRTRTRHHRRAPASRCRASRAPQEGALARGKTGRRQCEGLRSRWSTSGGWEDGPTPWLPAACPDPELDERSGVHWMLPTSKPVLCNSE